MKKLLVVLNLAMAVFSFQAGAATVNLGTINTSQDFGNTVNAVAGFSDTYNFTVPANHGIGASVTNIGVMFQTQVFGLISNFAATLDGVALSFQQTTIPGTFVFQALFGSIPGSAASSHTLVVTGNGTGSYGGNISVVAQTPIPAAVWLFGSALMGMTGLARRKKA